MKLRFEKIATAMVTRTDKMCHSYYARLIQGSKATISKSKKSKRSTTMGARGTRISGYQYLGGQKIIKLEDTDKSEADPVSYLGL